MKPFSSFLLRFALLTTAVAVTLPPNRAVAEEWKKVSSKDGAISAEFPVDLRDDLQTQTDKTLAGEVTSYFGEYHGDGIVLAASGADVPGIARVAGANKIYEESKKTFLKDAGGTETSYAETEVKGTSARLLLYKGDAYRGKGDPYTGRAILIMLNKRMYIFNSVLSKANEANKAAEKKMFDSIEISK